MRLGAGCLVILVLIACGILLFAVLGTIGTSGASGAATPTRVGAAPRPGATSPTSAPTLTPFPVLSGQFKVLKAGNKPAEGIIRHLSSGTGQCGDFQGTITLRGLRVLDPETFALDVSIDVVDGQRYFCWFNGIETVNLQIGGRSYRATASSFQNGLDRSVDGYLTFKGRIPLANPPQYKVGLTAQDRVNQPVEGWLAP